MPIIYVEYIFREDIRQNRQKLYVFGDNFLQKGYGGQAKECRGEPNTVGVPTKRLPSYNPSAYLSNIDLEEWRRKSKPAFREIYWALTSGQDVIFPAAGLGTGLAKLEQKAPLIWQELQKKIKYFHTIAKYTEGKKTHVRIKFTKSSL